MSAIHWTRPCERIYQQYPVMRTGPTHLVVNKMQSETDLEVVTQAITLPLLGVIPYDDDLAEAERRGMAPIDVAPQSRGAGDGHLVSGLEEMS